MADPSSAAAPGLLGQDGPRSYEEVARVTRQIVADLLSGLERKGVSPATWESMKQAGLSTDYSGVGTAEIAMGLVKDRALCFPSFRNNAHLNKHHLQGLSFDIIIASFGHRSQRDPQRGDQGE